MVGQRIKALKLTKNANFHKYGYSGGFDACPQILLAISKWG